MEGREGTVVGDETTSFSERREGPKGRGGREDGVLTEATDEDVGRVGGVSDRGRVGGGGRGISKMGTP